MVLRIGEQVGPYKITEQLGQGGMATVYKAYHAQLDRSVAIKVMHQNFLEDETFVTRFKREARIVAKLEHPHIVPIYDFNEYDKQPYLVMKYIEGKTLKAHLQQGALPLNDILHIINAVGGSLAYAHRQGILHRDIKPSNIVIDTDNTPYLTDFGLARLAAAGESTMSENMLLGTPHYISPEQARGVKEIDGRTDIYSLGVVLYELLVGRVPFTADTPFAIIHDHIYTPLPLPSRINPEIPPIIEEVLLMALAKRPEDRYASADEMVNDLRDAIEEANLKELSPDRVSVASTSLAQLRDDLQSQYESGVLPATPPGISAPSPSSLSVKTPILQQTATASTGSTPSVIPVITDTASLQKFKRQQQAQNIWPISGCGAFIVIVLLSLGILLSASNNITELLQLIEDNDDFNITFMGDLPINFNQATIEIDESYGFPLYDVPAPPESIVRQILNENPDDPIAYLVAANSAWQDDEQDTAYRYITQGLQHTESQSIYLINAAKVADENNDFIAAMAYQVVAYIITARDETQYYDQLRPYITEYIYNNAAKMDTDANLRTQIQPVIAEIFELSRLSATLIENAPVTPLIWAKNRIDNDDLNGIEAALDRIPDGILEPEVALLMGELRVMQNRPTAAVTEWRGIRQMDDTPQWVLDRIAELIDEATPNIRGN